MKKMIPFTKNFKEEIFNSIKDDKVQMLKESSMLDISIKSADKVLTSESKIKKFLNTRCFIESKTDGVKLTVFKISDEGNLSDWIFSYKNNILYPGEFDWQSKLKITNESVGSSQFQKVFDHFEKIGKNGIPVGTELQCEFLMRKSTLSSNYTHPHGIVLIQHSKSTFDETYLKFGKLKTKQIESGIDKRDTYAKILNLNVPLKIFDGILGKEYLFEKGIIYQGLRDIFETSKHTLDWENPEVLYDQIKEIFLAIPSVFGGKEEGVVIKTENGELLKWQQAYQVDQIARKLIKMRYREDDPIKENDYWERVKSVAYRLCEGIDNKLSLEKSLVILSDLMKRLRVEFTHSKKTESQIKDDIQLTSKTLLIKRLKGNNGCLVLGKFRLFTLGHKKLIDKALKEFDRVCICLVTSPDTKETRDLRYKSLKKVFGNNKDVEIIESQSGNIVRIIQQASFNINAVYTGTDRINGYEKQLSNSIGMSVREIKRTGEDISATKIITSIENKDFFIQNTPKEIHPLYREYLSVYSK